MTEKKTGLVGWGIALVVMILLAIGIAVVFRSEETYISGGDTTTRMVSAECVATDRVEDFFFSNKNAQRLSVKIKMIFKESVLDNISFDSEGTYNNNDDAETATAKLHADYNIYMADEGVNPEIYNPVFSSNKTKANISLYASYDKIDQPVAKIFFLDLEELPKEKFDMTNLKQYYESKGFTCKSY